MTGRFEILFKELGVNQSGDKAWQLYENNLSNSYFIIDGTIDVLEKLKNKYRLFIVSNGTASVQDKRIAGADISKYFECRNSYLLVQSEKKREYDRDKA